MTNNELKRRAFLKRAGQAGGLIIAGSALEPFLAACSDTIPTSSRRNTGISKIDDRGLKQAGFLQWGAISDNNAPYVYKDQTTAKLVGFELEIATSIASLMGVTQKQVETDYTQLEQALQANNFDMIMNRWEITNDRKKTEVFSQPYYRNGQQIVVRATDKRFATKTQHDDLSLKDLEGLTVGTSASFKAEELLASDDQIKLKSYDFDLPFNDLVLGHIDAILIDSPTVTYYALGYGVGSAANKALKLIGKPFEFSDHVIAFNKNAAILQKEIDQAISVLKNNGTLKNIYKKWGLWNDEQTQIDVK